MRADRPDHPGEDGLLVWNGTVAHVPPVVLRPTSARELADAMAFAHDHGLEVSIVDHGAPARMAPERTVTIDLSLMPDAAAAEARPGGRSPTTAPTPSSEPGRPVR